MLSHFLLMVVYALHLSLFFALLWRRGRRERVLLFCQIFASLVGGAVLLGWLMYPFPGSPAIPFP